MIVAMVGLGIATLVFTLIFVAEEEKGDATL